ncbi:MAG TPA: HAD family hydrolase [Candidatus Saccharimonadia bacterium]|jgi:D-glycero-D-manno-heptose 1,7-bisphosphate phosphatase|nr:HAD family hydrolase [Candidatus Saccharimonadia bacterium]
MKAILLDRDGTVIVDPPDERVDRVEKIKLFADSIEALKVLAGHGVGVIFITNQAGIAEGRMSEQEFEVINAEVVRQLAPSEVTVLKTFMCPHGPEDHCECRKPKPKLILDALKEFGLAAGDTYMVGDRQSDIIAGVNAGVKTVLVKTANVPVESAQADYTAPTLLDAVKYVVARLDKA